jgi:hypothetical protein
LARSIFYTSYYVDKVLFMDPEASKLKTNNGQ